MTAEIENVSINRKYGDRFIELDALRGVAIGLMILLHLLWDLDYFGVVPLNHEIYQMQKIVPLIFFALVGICLAICQQKKKYLSEEKQKQFNKHVATRGLKICGLGLIINIVSFIVMPERPVIFGVLHFIGLSIILSIPFLKLKKYNIITACIVWIIAFLMANFTIENPTVLHLIIGIHQPDIWRYTLDYFPLFPWFGGVLFGIFLGNVLYNGNERRFHLPDISNYRPICALSWMGKHSLAIYLGHQPIIAAMLSIYIFL
ncbi:MAG: DUF1624 domain-containing protein [Candidatus Thermoplasmatota archaeon]|nr:DUF1624 domain-containing protein [Candidatus Thermoplasmatota archaeon]